MIETARRMPTDRHAHGHSHPLPEATTLLRGRCQRRTRARPRIWDGLAAGPDAHLTADGLVTRSPGVDPSTVYRTLDVFVAEGIARSCDLGDGRAYIEPAHEHFHHHVACRRCRAVVDLHDDALGHAELTLSGLCPRCRTR